MSNPFMISSSSSDLCFSDDIPTISIDTLVEERKEEMARTAFLSEQPEVFIPPIDIEKFDLIDPTAMEIPDNQFPNEILNFIATTTQKPQLHLEFISSDILSLGPGPLPSIFYPTLLLRYLTAPSELLLTFIETHPPSVSEGVMPFCEWFWLFQNGDTTIKCILLRDAVALINEPNQQILRDLFLLFTGSLLTGKIVKHRFFPQIYANFKALLESLIEYNDLVGILCDFIREQSIQSATTFVSLLPLNSPLAHEIINSLLRDFMDYDLTIESLIHCFGLLQMDLERNPNAGGERLSLFILLIERFIVTSRDLEIDSVKHLIEEMKVSFSKQHGTNYIALKEQLQLTRVHLEMFITSVSQQEPVDEHVYDAVRSTLVISTI